MNVLTLEDMVKWLDATEDMASVTLKMDGSNGLAVFALAPGWNVGLADVDPQDPVDVEMQYNGIDYTLSKEAVLSIAHAVGLPPAYVTRTPGLLIGTHLNYWAKHMPDVDLKLLISSAADKPRVLTATKGGIVPFSNVGLMVAAMDGLHEAVPEASEAFDVNSYHGIHSTGIRVFDKVVSHVIDGEDWSFGLQVLNSLTGKHPLSVGLYLRNHTLNSGLVHYSDLSKYNRKIMGQDEFEVMHWVTNTSNDLLQSAAHEFEILESLKEESIADAVVPVLSDIFKNYKVPLKVRQVVMDNLIESEDLTYYGVVNALIKASAVDGLPDHFRTAIMEIAGAVMHDVSHRCNSCKKVI